MSDKNIKKLLLELTFEEKLSLLRGTNFWETVSVPRLGLPSLVLNDGPFGIRKPKDSSGAGINEETIPATSFPTTSALASSFDTELLKEMGETLAYECIDQGVDFLLGPGLNIKRSPLCGRNFEYFSEDPFVSATLAGALVQGIQKHGVGATIKHYAVNNQENERFTTNAIVDKRALNEIYLKAFHDIIKTTKPWAVMCSYNQVNGRHASRHHMLLTTKLRDEARFEGLVVSDWGAVINLVDSVNAGLNLEMPGGPQDIEELKTAISEGSLTIEKVDEAITPLLSLMLEKKNRNIKEINCDYDKNFKVAQKVGENSAVLLQNHDNILPLNPKSNIALIGNFAKNPRYQGSGSSKVFPTKLISLFTAMSEAKVSFTYADGYLEHETKANTKLIAEATEVAKGKDVVIIAAGLPESYEAEGYDRQVLDMPPSHNELIAAVARVNPNIVVVLSTGSPVTMPWLNDVKGLLLTHLMGGAVGSATYNLLYGHQNPSGKLAESYPLSLRNSIPGQSFLADSQNVPYKESIYVGYRYFDSYKVEVLFPFGHGLSYTKFKSYGLELTKEENEYKVKVHLENIGHLAGSEVVGIYVGHKTSMLYRPKKELKAFKKVSLRPFESRVVTLSFNEDELMVFDPVQDKWVLENGEYCVFVGINVQTSVETHQFKVENGETLNHLHEFKKDNSPYYNHDNYQLSVATFTALVKEQLPLYFPNRKRSFTLENSIADTTDYWLGRRLNSVMKMVAKKMSKGDPVMQKMAIETSKRIPFRAISALSSGAINRHQAEALVMIVNGRVINGTIKFLKKPKKEKSKR